MDSITIILLIVFLVSLVIGIGVFIYHKKTQKPTFDLNQLIWVIDIDNSTPKIKAALKLRSEDSNLKVFLISDKITVDVRYIDKFQNYFLVSQLDYIDSYFEDLRSSISKENN